MNNSSKGFLNQLKLIVIILLLSILLTLNIPPSLITANSTQHQYKYIETTKGQNIHSLTHPVIIQPIFQTTRGSQSTFNPPAVTNQTVV